MTRTHKKYMRAYIDGVDVSGYTRAVGALGWDIEFQPDTSLTDGCMNVIGGKPTISADGYSAFLDNDTAGVFVLTQTPGTRNYTVALGSLAAPVAGDPMFSWVFEQTAYKQESGEGFAAVTVPMGGASYSNLLTYAKPWGYVLHAKGAETAANTATGLDDFGAATTKGGIFVYHLFSSNGTVTLSAEDAATNTNPSFAALSGATSGSITAAVTPKSGMVALGTTATVRRYTRWQIALGTATTATFMLGLIRAT